MASLKDLFNIRRSLKKFQICSYQSYSESMINWPKLRLINLKDTNKINNFCDKMDSNSIRTASLRREGEMNVPIGMIV